MKSAVKTSLGILCLLSLISGDSEKSNGNFKEFCQALKCNPVTQICRRNSKCDDSNQMDLSKCVYCGLKDDGNQNLVSKTLLASSISQQLQPLAPRLLAKSGGTRLLAHNRGSSSTSTQSSSILSTSIQGNITLDDQSYDDYYEYDDDETSDRNYLGEEDDYLNDYAETLDKVIQDGSEPIRKLGICPKVVQSTAECDSSKIVQSDCRFDTDCSTDQKCCEVACGKRVCNKPTKVSVSVCPTAFSCALNCRLGYRTDLNGCLLCECQSCPPIDQCQKNCPSGYLKDLFGCDICECNDQCPPFSCNIACPLDMGYMKSNDGCPLCRCATPITKVTQRTSSCQDDVHCPPGFRCLNDAHNVPMCQAAPEVDASIDGCADSLPNTCDLQCSDGDYLLDSRGCPTCACASQVPPPPPQRIDSPPMGCPMVKCRANCGDAGYQLDDNGCQTCQCVSIQTQEIQLKPRIECSKVMCRMFCVHGFRRDENQCEVCQCNDAPQPCPQLNCDNTCPNGYRKDYSGCATCSCEEERVPPNRNIDGCSPMKCGLNCKYGFERDPSGCQLCSCNRCPLQSCRMFCMYGFRKNSEDCDVCECNWAPVAEQIPCSERIPCKGSRVCNFNLHLCEIVSADKVNWFVYNFAIRTEFFNDPEFVQAFKNGLINNIATRYDLEVGQITVSAVERDGTTSFQVMPYSREDPNGFQKKMDQIDLDLNSQEFRSVLPSVARDIDKNKHRSKWSGYLQKHPRLALYLTAVSFGLVALVLAGIMALICRQHVKYLKRSESKVPIYDTSYHQAPTEDDHYHAVHAPDGTAYVVVESEDMGTSKDKRALV